MIWRPIIVANFIQTDAGKAVVLLLHNPVSEMDMEVVIKISPQLFEKLRAAIPAGSKMAETLDSAARIDYAVDGVTFSGYEITCSYEQAQLLHRIVKQYCAEASFDLEKALKAASAAKA